LFLKSLPILIILKLYGFSRRRRFIEGIGVIRASAISSLLTKGVFLGSILSILAILLLYRFQYFSRAVFVLDGNILLFAVVSSR
jgi:hypothetical protein